jgi:glycogen debranching enzyme
MAQAPTPRVTTPAQRDAFYRAWATLWIDTQPAGGAWVHPVITPGNAYRYGVWLWDSGFHALGLSNGGLKARQLARWQIDEMLSGAVRSGPIPRTILRGGPSFTGALGVQAPGILTLAANHLYETATDPTEQAALRTQLARDYPILARNDLWFLGHTDAGRGLYGWSGIDSGWDNSPRWDTHPREALDLNCWLYLDQTELAKMALTVGRPAEAAAWQQRADQLRSRIQTLMWNAELGVFNDTNADGSVSPVITPVIAMPLFVGIATPEQAASIVARLEDPNGLWSPFPLASVAQDQPTYQPDAYWRGPVWINLNWMAICGMERYGFTAEAAALRARTLDLVAATPAMHEYYNSQTGQGLGSPNFGWTSALFIDLAVNP